MNRKLELEALEDRLLATTGLTSLTAPVTPLSSSATTYSLTSPLNGWSLVPNDLTLVRSFDWVSGVRINHNQTLVRDASRKARRR
jgi:hypothetical protein